MTIDQKEPNLSTSTETRPRQEPEGHEGTLGGQPPLNAKAGIQGTRRGGVLVEKDARGDDKAGPA